MANGKRTIYIKEADIIYDTKRKNCFGQQGGKRNILMERLESLFDVQYSDDPDIVISYVPVGMATGFDYDRYRDKVLVHCILENVYPDFNAFDYCISGWHTLDMKKRYLYIPASILSCDITRESYELMRKKHLDIDEEKMPRRDFCSFTVSNLYDAGQEREQFFHMLSKYKKIHSGGGCVQ